ncbi:hypothetical protein ACJMK2_027595 [Sinanodonta woodiana]|uniref:G-protein coupled receptors family 1 profile domain-containing protein n=1 Tax=Sinanodonta woodiana TaxID=1069815 RepID=A0ABD3X807_SINWO
MFYSVSSSEEGTLLQKRSSELTIVFIPVVIFVSVLMILGLFGNSMVMYFYGWKTKKTPNICFILVLAVFDLLTCTLGMPMEIVDLVLNITFYNVVACKILRFVTYFTNIASALILASIAVDRYRRICKPHTKQLSIKQVKIICGLCASASVLVSWPASIFFMIERVSVIYTDPKNTTYQANITGCDCTLTKSKRYSPYILTFHVVHLIGFVALTISLAVMYGLIARRLYYYSTQRLDFAAFNQRRSRSAELPPEQSDTSYVTTADFSPVTDSQRFRGSSNFNYIDQPVSILEELDENVMDDKVKVNDDIVPASIVRSNEQCNPSSKGISSLQDLPNLEAVPCENKMTLKINRDIHGSQSIRFRTGKRDNSVVKHTVMLFIVALVFVLSFLPYLGVAINGLFLDGYDANIFTDDQLVGFELGYRSHFINGAFNPIIYGFFNSQFRYYVYKTICPCRFGTGGGRGLK